MLIPRPARLLVRGLALLHAAAWLALAPSAHAAPVQYSIAGTLDALGADPLQLDGATLEIVVDADTVTLPGSTTVFPNVSFAFFADTALATFSDRPGGAPDQQLSYVLQLRTINRVETSSNTDAFGLLNAEEASFEGTGILAPHVIWNFLGNDFYPDDDPAGLPTFDAGDVSLIEVTERLRDAAGNPLYVFRLPEAAASWLLAVSVLGIARRRRGLRRP